MGGPYGALGGMPIGGGGGMPGGGGARGWFDPGGAGGGGTMPGGPGGGMGICGIPVWHKQNVEVLDFLFLQYQTIAMKICSKSRTDESLVFRGELNFLYLHRFKSDPECASVILSKEAAG